MQKLFSLPKYLNVLSNPSTVSERSVCSGSSLVIFSSLELLSKIKVSEKEESMSWFKRLYRVVKCCVRGLRKLTLAKVEFHETSDLWAKIKECYISGIQASGDPRILDMSFQMTKGTVPLYNKRTFCFNMH